MKNLLSLALVAALGFSLLALGASTTEANPSRITVCSTHATTGTTHSTTTLRYMTPGTATTTLECAIDGIDQVDLNIISRASSTNTTLQWRYEYSWNNTDWYQSEHDLYIAAASSTVWTASSFTAYTWKFASSTSDFSSGNASTSFKRVQVKDLGTRYMRVVFFLPAGSANSAVYAEVLKKEQQRN